MRISDWSSDVCSSDLDLIDPWSRFARRARSAPRPGSPSTIYGGISDTLGRMNTGRFRVGRCWYPSETPRDQGVPSWELRCWPLRSCVRPYGTTGLAGFGGSPKSGIAPGYGPLQDWGARTSTLGGEAGR